MGPSALLAPEIHASTRELGCDVAGHGDVGVSSAETREPGDSTLKSLKEIRETCEAVRDVVAGVLAAGRMPIALGGDHATAMGSIGAASQRPRQDDKKI